MSFIKQLSSEQVLQIIQTISTDTSDETKKYLNSVFHEFVKLRCHLPIIKLLLQDVRINPDIDSELFGSIIKSDNIELLELLLQDPRIDPSISNSRALRVAAETGRSAMVKLLLQDARIDPNCCKGYPIGLAAQKGHTDVVKLLLQDPRVNPSLDDNYALNNASLHGNTEIVKLLLLDPRVDPQFPNNDSIKNASRGNHIDIVKLLIPRIDLSKITDTKILDIAKSMCDPVLIQSTDTIIDTTADTSPKSETILVLESLFLNDKYDVNFFNQMFYNARNRNDLEVIEYLLKKQKVSFEICTTKTISWAIQNNHILIVKLLSILNRTSKSCTEFIGSLFMAIELGHEEIVEILVNNNYAIDEHGYNSYIKIAFDKNLPRTVKLLSTKTDMTKIYDIRIHVMAQ